jgi:hypothetical protein
MAAIRRLRQAPHASAEGRQIGVAQFSVELEAGVGRTTGQGDDPQVALRYSDDGGHTWSNELWTSAGAVGQYKRRAVWRRLGLARTRTFQVVISDPVKVTLVGAYLEVR